MTGPESHITRLQSYVTEADMAGARARSAAAMSAEERAALAAARVRAARTTVRLARRAGVGGEVLLDVLGALGLDLDDVRAAEQPRGATT